MSRNSGFQSLWAAARRAPSFRSRSPFRTKPAAVRRLSLETLEERVVLHAAFDKLGDLLASQFEGAAAEIDRHVVAASHSQASLHAQSRTEHINGAPFEFTWDPGAAAGAAPSGAAASGALSPLTSIPVLNSFPGATASLYLDFNGHFDASWGSYRNVTTPVFDQDGDAATFSAGELATMQEIWTIVAEDYAPFKINVTTVQPASFANGVAMRVAIGGDGAWSGGTYGGIAYVGSFTNSIVNTSYVFPKNLSNGYARYTAEASSHEAGHSFGLQHQSQYDASGTKINEYYSGTADGRAPIMGTSYYATRGLWWYGTSSTGATVYQDDMAVISNATNAFGYRADDYANATPLAVSGRDVSGAGIVEKLADQDAYTFTAAAGEMNISVAVPAGVGNLNARLELRDASGNLLAVSDSANFAAWREISYNAAGGAYKLVVASHGGSGDVGKYAIGGTIPVASTINTPTGLAAAANSTGQVDLSWIDNAVNEAGYYVDRSTNGGQTWSRLTAQPLPADSTGFFDAAALWGATRTYRVSAVNADDVSAYSSRATATTVPGAPSSLTATALWSDQVFLAWGGTGGATGYKVERSSDGGNSWLQIAAVGANVRNVTDAGLQSASPYSYRVRATNAGGDSAYSAVAAATTFIASPASFGPNDGAFIVESWSGSYNDLAILPSGQILAAGSKYSTDPANQYDHRMVVARYNSSGSVDASYGTAGITAPAFLSSIEYGYGLALQSDGKAVVAGLANHGHAAARFNANGSLDTNYGSGGLAVVDVLPNDFYSPATAVGLQSTGKAVIAGVALDTSTVVDPAVLARFSTSGAVDSGKNGFGKVVQGKAPGYNLGTFGGNNNGFNDLAVQADDKIVVVGQSVNDGNGGFLLARYTASGVLDTTFNGNGYSVFLPAGIASARASALTLQTNGKIVVVGYCTGIDGANDLLVARYNANGTLDASFGAGSGYVRLDVDGTAVQSSESARDVVVQQDGKIVVSGSRSIGSNPSDVVVVRLNSNGALDATFGTGGFKTASLPPEMGAHGLSVGRLALLSDGTIIVSGSGDWAPAGTSDLKYYHPFLMRFSGAATSPLLAAIAPADGVPNGETLTLSQVQPILAEAVARWHVAGADAVALSVIDVRIADLPGNMLGQAAGGTITLDVNAAGWGWFVDRTPGDDAEFSMAGDQGEQHRMDLLSAVMHELGHVLGLEHNDCDDDAMHETLAAGERHASIDEHDAALFALLAEFDLGLARGKQSKLPWNLLTDEAA